MRTRLRRYPALGFLAVAALLASLLPSALRVPLSGPSASAELAPVPGRSDSAQGDLSALGETSTGGLGSGSGLGAGGGLGALGRGGPGAGGGDDDEATPPPGSGRNLRTKHCVGNPPRQTEDPLSPPCVAYFKGDNGGATAMGVTKDEIVVVYERAGCAGQTTTYTDYDDPDDPEVDPDVAAYVRYFNERFQLYERRVHLYGVDRACGMTDDAFMAEIDQRLRPFYVFSGFIPIGRSFGVAAAGRGIIAAVRGPKRETTLHRPPYILSYEPDHDDLMASAAEFLCARLAGLPARFAGDPTLNDRTRKFGLVYNDGQLDPTNEGAGWFLDRVRSRCGETAGEIVIGYVGNRNAETGSARAQRDQEAVARMRLAGVTTVVFMESTFQSVIQAEAAKWYPEWFVLDNYGRAGSNHETRFPVIPASQWSHAFGMTSMRRYGPPAEQPQVVALREGCPSCTGPGSLHKYDRLLLLFWGIQAAGPKLTPANLDRGLHAIPARRSLDPFTPAAYFAPGNYSFVKDWAAVWWDPTGVPPGTGKPGCWRLVEDGLRYRVEDWQKRPGDEGIQDRSAGQPCQGDVGEL